MTENTFIHEKYILLSELNKHSDKLLFPTSVIASMKKQRLIISSFMKDYNDYLIKIRELYTSLNKLERWGLLIDSHTNWKFSIYRNISGLNIYFQEIIKFINNSDDIFINMIKNQCGLKIEKLFIYMTIIKKNNKYIWINTNKNEEHEFNQLQVINFLPRCINVLDGNLTLEDNHKLDTSDNLTLDTSDNLTLDKSDNLTLDTSDNLK